jgi:hypothetical protein
MNKIEGYEPEIHEEDRCSCGGAHTWHEFHTTELIQILRCSKCNKDSVGYLFDPDKEESK